MARRTRIPVVDYPVRISDNIVKVKGPAKHLGHERLYRFNGIIDARNPYNWVWEKVEVSFKVTSAHKLIFDKETLSLLAIEGLEAAIFDELDNDEGEDYNPEIDTTKI
jgi:hypothetical protein